MTSPTSAAPRHNRRAFSLTEMLVAIAVIALLAGIILPVILKAQATAKRTRAAADLQTISTALEEFKNQTGNYPEAGISNGAFVLGQSLLKPVPGKGAKTYGPFLNTDKFRLIPGPAGGIADLWSDRDQGTQHPILYFYARPGKPNIHLPGGYLSSVIPTPAAAMEISLYDVRHNAAAIQRVTETDTTNAEKRIHVALGDVDFTTPASAGAITLNEKGVDLPFLLWSAGPDRIYGPVANPPTADNWADCDDVTNFR